MSINSLMQFDFVVPYFVKKTCLGYLKSYIWTSQISGSVPFNVSNADTVERVYIVPLAVILFQQTVMKMP